MAGGALRSSKSLWDLFRWEGDDGYAKIRLTDCFNYYFSINGYSQYIKANKTERGGFFLNIYDSSKRQIAHMSFHTGRLGAGTTGQTHFKFDIQPRRLGSFPQPTIEDLLDISINYSYGSRTNVSTIRIITTNEYVNNFLNTFTINGIPIRDIINSAFLYVYHPCLSLKNKRSTPHKNSTIPSVATGHRGKGGRTRYRGRGTRLFGPAAGAGTGGRKHKSKRKSKARMTKKKRKVNGVIRNIRISKTGRKYVLLKGKKHYL